MKYLLVLHLIAVICWFAGLFYLPRLFVYHVEAVSAETKHQFKIMERKLYWYIMMPAMALTLLSGMGLMVMYVYLQPMHLGWLWLKLFLVLLLILFHFFCGYCVTVFAQDENQCSARFYRIVNEIPTVLLVMIVFLVVLKPF